MGKFNFSCQEYDNGFLFIGERTRCSIEEPQEKWVQKLCSTPMDVIAEVAALLDLNFESTRTSIPASEAGISE